MLLHIQDLVFYSSFLSVNKKRRYKLNTLFYQGLLSCSFLTFVKQTSFSQMMLFEWGFSVLNYERLPLACKAFWVLPKHAFIFWYGLLKL